MLKIKGHVQARIGCSPRFPSQARKRGTSARGLCVKSSSSCTYSSKTMPENDENSGKKQYCELTL